MTTGTSSPDAASSDGVVVGARAPPSRETRTAAADVPRLRSVATSCCCSWRSAAVDWRCSVAGRSTAATPPVTVTLPEGRAVPLGAPLVTAGASQDGGPASTCSTSVVAVDVRSSSHRTSGTSSPLTRAEKTTERSANVRRKRESSRSSRSGASLMRHCPPWRTRVSGTSSAAPGTAGRYRPAGSTSAVTAVLTRTDTGPAPEASPEASSTAREVCGCTTVRAVGRHVDRRAKARKSRAARKSSSTPTPASRKPLTTSSGVAPSRGPTGSTR